MNDKYNELSSQEEKVILEKGTELPFTGKYYNHFEHGLYVCKRCESPLYRSDDKFHTSCGWPSFDDEIPGTVTRIPDKDGIRTEIICTNCGAHLGHVFEGENLTSKNTRHCVNSVSLKFIPEATVPKEEKAYFAGGCFWGVEHLFQQKKAVISAESGYMGGETENPSYDEVCYYNTGHVETVEITYNPDEITFEDLAKYFFEIHDPTQLNRQGPDIGKQYKSVIFYNNIKEKKTAEKLISILKNKGYDVVTELRPAEKFRKAEDYHQDYYVNTGKKPYCHIYKKRF